MPQHRRSTDDADDVRPRTFAESRTPRQRSPLRRISSSTQTVEPSTSSRALRSRRRLAWCTSAREPQGMCRSRAASFEVVLVRGLRHVRLRVPRQPCSDSSASFEARGPIVEDGSSLTRVAERFQVSRPIAKRWADWYRQFGQAWMQDRSSRQARQPTRKTRSGRRATEPRRPRLYSRTAPRQQGRALCASVTMCSAWCAAVASAGQPVPDEVADAVVDGRLVGSSGGGRVERSQHW